jgi:hypothetical protein
MPFKIFSPYAEHSPSQKFYRNFCEWFMAVP